MSEVNFYAIGQDYAQLLDHIFSLDCRILEGYSAYDQDLYEYYSSADVLERYQIGGWDDDALPDLNLRIYPVQAGGQIYLQHIDLNPKYCDGATRRTCCQGWGLIQMLMNGVFEGDIRVSIANHISVKRALWCQPQYPEFGPVDSWDFEAVASVLKAIKKFVRTNSIGKYENRFVMKCASRFFHVE